MQTFTATYSPDDNKLRLYASTRLDSDDYARVKEAGFSWAPKQGLFVAPMWTPAREDLLLDLAGEIGDEDTSLVERAEERADRFDDYAGKRSADAETARRAVATIADGIPLGQPILVGHHSEKHARKDAQRIEDGMRRAVRLWETADYWRSRATGAIHAAKYKERPDVRARRIKGLEADQRKQAKSRAAAAEGLALWLGLEILVNDPDAQLARARLIAGNTVHGRLYVAPHAELANNHWSAYDVLLPDGERYKTCPSGWTVAQVIDVARDHYPRVMDYCDRWLEHIANRLAYERAMLGEAGGTVADQTMPEKGGACRCWASPRGGWSFIQKVSRVTVTVLDSYGNGGRDFTRLIPLDKLTAVMPAADVQAARKAGRIVEADGRVGFFLRDDPPPEPPEPRDTPADAGAFAAIKTTLDAGVTVAVVPQLFPTPPGVAHTMVSMAEIQPCSRVLEPSAGTGNIIQAMPPSIELLAVEINLDLANRLEGDRTSQHHTVLQADFLECGDGRDFNIGTFDRILMNPPFANGADIKHILHAREFLRPGGRLVAICADGPRQREKLRPIAATWMPLGADTFAAEGTAVRTVLLVIDAPTEPAPVVKAQPKPWFAMIERT